MAFVSPMAYLRGGIKIEGKCKTNEVQESKIMYNAPKRTNVEFGVPTCSYIFIINL
jgi:hypothetical protein